MSAKAKTKRRVRQTTRKAQTLVAKRIRPGRDLAQELIADRRKEAARE
jgi:hypothetical protein